MTEARYCRLTLLVLGDSIQLTIADLKDVHLQLPSLKQLEFHQASFAHVSSMSDKYVSITCLLLYCKHSVPLSDCGHHIAPLLSQLELWIRLH